MTVTDLLYLAFRQARIKTRPMGASGALYPGITQNELTDGLLILNQLVDEWSALKRFAYSTTFVQYTLTANVQPILIGPTLVSPNFAIASRPMRIESAQLVLNNETPEITLPINIRDAAWWAQNRQKQVQTNIPTDLYYEADYPNGQLNFWPLQNSNFPVILEIWVLVSQFATLASPVVLPPAYQKALTMTVGEELCGLWGVPIPELLPGKARAARAAVQTNNALPPRIASADIGTTGRSRGDFSYFTGTIP